MQTLLGGENYDPRIKALIDERLFKAFWDGVQHFGTKDLVLFFDLTEAEDPVTILPRDRMANEKTLSASFKEKITKPARDAAFQLSVGETAFWLVVHYADGDGACVAINAKPIAPGGNA